jgi:hypothetical protein
MSYRRLNKLGMDKVRHKIIIQSILANEPLARKYSKERITPITAEGTVWYLNDEGEWVDIGNVNDTDLPLLEWTSVKELNKMIKSDNKDTATIESIETTKPVEPESTIPNWSRRHHEPDPDLRGFWKWARLIAHVFRFIKFIKKGR